MAIDPELRAHQEWIGLLQPVGVVVSPPALHKGQATLPKHVSEQQEALAEIATVETVGEETRVTVALPALVTRVLRWRDDDLVDTRDDVSLEITLPEYGETLRPEWGVRDVEHPDQWLLLVDEVPAGTDLDAPERTDEGWHASPQARLERLLREKNVPVGLLTNQTSLRLVYAPRGESSGHVTFPYATMLEVGARPILGALLLLLDDWRLFGAPSAQRLPALLKDSRKYQSEVSTALAEQVLAALHELLRGFLAADEATGHKLLGSIPKDDVQSVYGGLLTVLLRLVFLLYAEDRGLLPRDETYQRFYAVTGLFEQLREDVGRYPDTMDQRYGAWSRLLAVFRLIYDGGGHGPVLRLPAREGVLFDPDRYPFLEGRAHGILRSKGERLVPPRVSDGTVWRVLQNLLLLDGERLSYRALDVEQIGSVYEAVMGFALVETTGRSIAVRPHHVVVDLDALLAKTPKQRIEALDELKATPSGKAADAVKNAQTVDDLVAALGRKISPTCLNDDKTPRVLPRGTLALQPGDERRRSGSHYTPRSLTEPIVRTTLRPVLEALGPEPRPEQILALRVCDPAMGSGAFLVEACRQLGGALVAGWARHQQTPVIPTDEDPVLHARRLVAETCLYGVDKNPFAVSLAKLSLWLVTLAKDHPFTFLDHALKHGDSLVGLTKAQIAAFHWDRDKAAKYVERPLLNEVARNVGVAAAYRTELAALGDDAETWRKREKLKDADAAVEAARTRGDLVVAAFFAGAKDKEREKKRDELNKLLATSRTDVQARVQVDDVLDEMRADERPLVPFHWEIEFPEVFARGGFDAIVGNPPFAGKNTIAAGQREGFLDWLKNVHEESHGNADLVAHFYRRSFDVLRDGGAMGLIATNTIAQGDTRSTGLRWICKHGGTIYEATKRVKWPGMAAVVVSVVHVRKGAHAGVKRLDGKEVPIVTAFLFHAGGHDDPEPLAENAGKSFIGSYVLGMGFTFDDDNPEATPIAEMHRLIEKDPRNAERIFPYIGGEEVNDSPTHAHRRYVINFGTMPESEARRWPDLMDIVETKVKPGRQLQASIVSPERWWMFARSASDLMTATQGATEVLATVLHTKNLSFVLLPRRTVFSHALAVVSLGLPAFPILQSRVHEVWARFFGSSLEDRLRYAVADCFETFPFPAEWARSPTLQEQGESYYAYRAELMKQHGEGPTVTYNRFNDPDERDPGILRLRELHAAMDRAVLDAYGWTDLHPTCEFLLDYEEPDDDEAEDGKKRRRKKPWRYRWPDAFRDEVLARLLDLNRTRAATDRSQSDSRYGTC